MEGLRDEVHYWVTRILNPYIVELYSIKSQNPFGEHLEPVLERLEAVRETAFERGLVEAANELIRLYADYVIPRRLPEAMRGEVKRVLDELFRASDEYFERKLGIERVFSELLRRLSPLKLTVRVLTRESEPLQGALVQVFRGGNMAFIDEAYTDDEGRAYFELAEGDYTVWVHKVEQDYYVFCRGEVKLIEDSELKLLVEKRTREIRRPRVPAPSLARRIPLPPPPPSCRPLMEEHEKWMQMAFARQLLSLGSFEGRRVIDVRHSCTLAGFRRFWNQWYYDPALRPLLVAREMDVLMLLEGGVLHGFELKSAKGVRRGDYGFKAEPVYHFYGIEYVWIVHWRIGDLNIHRRILEEIEKRCPSVGYIIYTPNEIEILKRPNRNPRLGEEDVKKRNRVIKKYFHLVGGTPPSY